ncbi:hypothetical protein BKA60DRAFT_581614 [Fusarium oxysporum]|nr:hypothetical protein BKA60DRAFT_581614 [Fusarium oxysporum]
MALVATFCLYFLLVQLQSLCGSSIVCVEFFSYHVILRQGAISCASHFWDLKKMMYSATSINYHERAAKLIQSRII